MKNILNKLWVAVKVVVGFAALWVGIVWAVAWYHVNYNSYNARAAKYEGMYNSMAKWAQHRAPLFYYVESGTVNANVTAFRVVLYSGLTKYAKNDSEVAMVLAHEISHYELGHVFESDRNQGQYVMNEAMADKLAVYFMEKAGYDVCKGRMFFKRLYDTYGDKPFFTHHPSNAYRYMALTMHRCGG